MAQLLVKTVSGSSIYIDPTQVDVVMGAHIGTDANYPYQLWVRCLGSDQLLRLIDDAEGSVAKQFPNTIEAEKIGREHGHQLRLVRAAITARAASESSIYLLSPGEFGAFLLEHLNEVESEISEVLPGGANLAVWADEVVLRTMSLVAADNRRITEALTSPDVEPPVVAYLQLPVYRQGAVALHGFTMQLAF